MTSRKGKNGLMYAPVEDDARHAITGLQKEIVNARLKSTETRAVRTLTEKKELLEAVTEALLRERELGAGQIEALLETAGVMPPAGPSEADQPDVPAM